MHGRTASQPPKIVFEGWLVRLGPDSCVPTVVYLRTYVADVCACLMCMPDVKAVFVLTYQYVYIIMIRLSDSVH